MNWSHKWQKVKEEELGKGGQGSVYLVCPKEDPTIGSDIMIPVEEMSNRFHSFETKSKAFVRFKNAIIKLATAKDPESFGALKILHDPIDARDFENAEERIKREIEAMSTFVHSNLLRIIDRDPDSKWFISQYHANCTLAQHIDTYAGNFVAALAAFRPLVAAVAYLHSKCVVHRDIKPQNIFIDNKDNLILGDFGIVFFDDDKHTRVSYSLENVGSRDWMPAWAYGRRIEDIKPSFDVFSLGKTLWSMITGKSMLPLWYHKKPDNDVQRLFPNSDYIEFANLLFDKCIVEEESRCLPDASALLDEVDKILKIVHNHADMISDNIQRNCRVCGIGKFNIIANKNPSKIHQFGIMPTGSNLFKIYSCSHCGNVQLFYFRDGKNPPAWD